jgi:hypothetical protein
MLSVFAATDEQCPAASDSWLGVDNCAAAPRANFPMAPDVPPRWFSAVPPASSDGPLGHDLRRGPSPHKERCRRAAVNVANAVGHFLISLWA